MPMPPDVWGTYPHSLLIKAEVLILRRRKQKFKKLSFNRRFRHETAPREPWFGRTRRNESETYGLDFPYAKPQNNLKGKEQTVTRLFSGLSS